MAEHERIENPILKMGRFGGDENYTLRDKIATAVLQAQLSNTETIKVIGGRSNSQEEMMDKMAEVAYKQADAMLKERMK